MKKESKNLEYGCIKDQGPYPNEDQDAKLPSQEPPAPIKAPNKDFKDIDFCTFIIKIESQNLELMCIKDKWPYVIKIKILNPSQTHPSPT